MFGLAQLERPVAGFGLWIHQFLGFEHVAAVVALVGARAFEAADVTGTFDVAIGQEFFADWANTTASTSV